MVVFIGTNNFISHSKIVICKTCHYSWPGVEIILSVPKFTANLSIAVYFSRCSTNFGTLSS